MDFRVTSTASAYMPAQGYAQQVGARGHGATDAQNYSTTAGGNRQLTTGTRNEASPESQKAREETARKQDPSAEVSRSPGFSFEYEDNQRVMKVHNTKGILIYQVPSKGQLALIQAEDTAAQSSARLSLTA